MIIFHEPTTMMLAAGLAMSAVGAGVSAVSAHQQSQAAAGDAELQARLEQTAAARDIRDEREENKRQLARTRALLSAGGVDVGTVIDLTGAQQRESLIRQHRIRTDSSVRRGTLRTQARNIRQAGRTQFGADLVGAGGGLLTGGAALSRGLPTSGSGIRSGGSVKSSGWTRTLA